MAEKEKPKLTNKQKVFIDEYLKCFNATAAAKAAGYSEKTAYSMGWENLRKPEIKAEIEARLDEVHMGSDEALKLLADMARGDLADFMAISSMGFSLDLEHAREQNKTKLIKKVRQQTVIDGKQDKETHTIDIELHDAQAALEKILRVHGKFKDVGTKDNPLVVTWKQFVESTKDANGDAGT